MALTRLAALVWLMACPLAWADTASPAQSVPPPASPHVAPPVPLDIPPIPFPIGAPTNRPVVDVQVHLVISATGQVVDVKLIRGAGEPFDSAVLEGARRFRFRPALIDGQPAEVIVPYTQHFVVPVKAQVSPAGPGLRRDAVLLGIVQERGTRAYVEGMDVVARVRGRDYATVTDRRGRFRLAIPSGEAVVRAGDSEHRPFLQRETLSPSQEVKVRYLVDRLNNDRHEIVIEAERNRDEISRTTLTGRELTQVPGTFGDPFRAVTLLPGVTTVMSLLPSPIVRGSSPGDTGELLDGIPVPMLFHLFAGPSIIPPELMERVDFFPGNFPVQYGGYTGGIIDGITQSQNPKPATDLELSLTEAGAFLRRTFNVDGGLTVTAGGHYGYPGLILSLLTPDVSLSYWDYQGRIDGHLFGGRWTIFAYGARDSLQESNIGATGTSGLQTVVMLETNHVDLRWQTGGDDQFRSVRIVLMDDESRLGPDMDTRTLSLWPRFRFTQRLLPSLRLEAGLDGQVNGITSTRILVNNPVLAALSAGMEDSGTVLGAGAYLQLDWRPIHRLTIIPGVRADLLHDASNTRKSADPRIMLRYELSDRELGGTTLKAGTGWYHAAPQLGLPIPGVSQAKLSFPLLAAEQTSVGAEVRLGHAAEFSTEAYYNVMNPLEFDLSLNPSASQVQAMPTMDPSGMLGSMVLPMSLQTNAVNRLFDSTRGRAYGLEFLLRKRDADNVFGWIAYTLSRSERLMSGKWVPYDFDRTHILNAVAGYRLPRNWELGVRLLYETGTPVTTSYGYNTGRTDPDFMVDVRVDKRAIWNQWMLDFYFDVTNATVSPDTGGLLTGQSIRYVVPNLGIQAVL